MLENQPLHAAAKAAVLDSVLESATDAIITVDAQQKIVFFSPAAEAMFGWRRQDVMHQPLEMLIPQRFREGHASHFKAFDATGATSRSLGGLAPALHGLHANGAQFPLSMSISQVATPAGKLFTAIVRDITDQRVSQAQLTLLKTSLSYLNDMVVITEAGPLDEPGPRIVFVNAAFERHTGYSLAEVLGRTPRLLQGPQTQRL